MTVPVVHIAGLDVQVGPLLRQRCAWCGYVLVDYDLRLVASPCDERCESGGCVPENHMPATWPRGGLVQVDGPLSQVMPHHDGDELPATACTPRQPAEVAG